MVHEDSVLVLGGGLEVGRLAVHLTLDGVGVMLDYGVGFGENGEPLLPLYKSPSEVKAIIISHAHLDHSGAAPIFYVSTTIRAYMTKATRDLLKVMYNDFLHLSGYYLPFEHLEVRKLLRSTKAVSYGDVEEVNGVTLEFYDAGHIPGSMITVVRGRRHSVAFTGDVNSVETRLTRPADVASIDADTLIIESTYALTNHPKRESVERRFIEAVREVVEDGGIVLVPAFSLGRSQEVLCVLHAYSNKISCPVYYDGMVREVNRILLSNPGHLKDPAALKAALSWATEVRGWEDRRRVLKGPAIIVSSAGMLKGGPALYYLKRIANDSRNAILLVSFQAPGTPGRRILELGSPFPDMPRVKARVEWFDFSSHAGREGLIEVAKSIKGLERVIVVHGERKAAESLATAINEQLGVRAYAVENGMLIQLD